MTAGLESIPGSGSAHILYTQTYVWYIIHHIPLHTHCTHKHIYGTSYIIYHYTITHCTHTHMYGTSYIIYHVWFRPVLHNNAIHFVCVCVFCLLRWRRHTRSPVRVVPVPRAQRRALHTSRAWSQPHLQVCMRVCMHVCMHVSVCVCM